MRLDAHCFSVHYYSVIKNVTLSAEEKLIEAARERAQQERTTLNNVFRDWLNRYAGQPATPDAYRTLMKRLKHVSTGGRFTREELNER